MDVVVDYLSDIGHILVTTDDPLNDIWRSFSRSLVDYADDYYLYENGVSFLWRYFLPHRVEVAAYFRSFGVQVSLSDSARDLFVRVNERSYNASINKENVSIAEIEDVLKAKGFSRKLTANQKTNLSKICNMPACATFSVPGAGKTTEALAYYCYNSDDNSKLLVVAPKNAFGAWDEQLEICFNGQGFQMIRLVGGEKAIRKKISAKPKFSIITYNQFTKVKKLITDFLANNDIIMFLDESHRIKNNRGGVTTESILDVSFYPERKMIMSGTPMPQSVEDLVPQFRFLYPDMDVDSGAVVQLFQPLFVRTTKAQLGLPKVERQRKRIEMDDLQKNIYSLLKSEVKRQLNGMLNDDSRAKLRNIGKCLVKVMQFTSNPSLLALDMDYAFNQQVGELLLRCNGPKIEYACKRARELASENKKVIIWSSFVRNVELIAERLKDLGAEYIHGGVNAGSDEEDDTREWKIKRFHNDCNCMVLVANPAAASEGISLHTVCHHAIYVDRSFNAAQYLQSEDRIHRLGLKEDQITYVEILECRDTIDEVIYDRLTSKVQTMSDALDDPSLNIDAIPYDYDEDDLEYPYLTDDDVKSVYNHFFGGD